MNKRLHIIHPILFGIYPALFLFSSNISQTEPLQLLRPLLLSALGALSLTLILRFFLGEWNKAGLLSSFIQALFYAYGHVYLAIEGITVAGVNIGRHRYLAIIWLVMIAVGAWWILRKHSPTLRSTKVVVTIASTAVLLPLITIATYQIQSKRAEIVTNQTPSMGSYSDTLPDVYHIVLDAYARDDILEILYSFDNEPFLTELSERGFYIARDSHSNYNNTILSLASTLNMNYVHTILDPFDPSSTNLEGLIGTIKHSAVREAFEELGYTTVAFSTGFRATDITDVDEYLSPEIEAGFIGWLFSPMNAFESLLFQTTALRFWTAIKVNLPVELGPDIDAAYEAHRERILFAFSQAEILSELDGPLYVFMHVISPHPPFIFGPNGERLDAVDAFTLKTANDFADRDEYTDGYTGQLTYLNSLLLSFLDELIDRSTRPVIILLHADHGSGASAVGESYSPVPYSVERFSILNAYRLDGCAISEAYADITPVNSYRLIFQGCFKSEIEMIEDRIYNSGYGEPLNLVDVTENIGKP